MVTTLSDLERMTPYITDLPNVSPRVAAEQPVLTPDFNFGHQLEDLEGVLRDMLGGKGLLVIGAGDIWPKFVRWASDHVGIDNITVLELNPPPANMQWQYDALKADGKIKVVTQAEFAADPSLIKGEDFAFSFGCTPPKGHFAAVEQSFGLGLPIMLEKPAFLSVAEFEQCKALQQEKQIPIVFVDWEYPLSRTLHAALGHEVPFAGSIQIDYPEKFAAFTDGEIASVETNFVEGVGNPLVKAGHRVHLSKSPSQGGGMVWDLVTHTSAPVTLIGFELEEVISAKLGKPLKTGEFGIYEQIGREDVPPDEQTAGDGSVHAEMLMVFQRGQKGIKVIHEAGKLGLVNDMKVTIRYKNNYVVTYEFGHTQSEVKLYDPSGAVVATGKGHGDPYAFFLVEGAYIFDQWRKGGPAIMAYGTATREAIKICEAIHQVGRAEYVEPGTFVRQSALENQPMDSPEILTRRKTSTYQTVKIEDYQLISEPNECWTAEGPFFDKQLGFGFSDIEGGKVVLFDPNTHRRTTWSLTSGEMGPDGFPKQMVGGTTAVNQDGCLLVMLDMGGPDAGLHYLDVATHQLYKVADLPVNEHPRNRPNDATRIKLFDKMHLLWSSMSRIWNQLCNPDGSFQRNGNYYVVDSETFESRILTFEGGVHRAPIITNGLADGGPLKDGKRRLFWAETVENPGESGEGIRVYRGTLDPETLHVSNITVFKTHAQLGGTRNGRGTHGRPDGAEMALWGRKGVYGVSVLETGALRFFDPRSGALALDVRLPEGVTRNTKFALGWNAQGDNLGVVTTLDAARRTRRPKPDGSFEYEGDNGGVIMFKLPSGLRAHPGSVSRVEYPSLELLNSQARLPKGRALSPSYATYGLT